jgi:hypothetical protein
VRGARFSCPRIKAPRHQQSFRKSSIISASRVNEPIGALARVGLCFYLEAQTLDAADVAARASARKAYLYFLALWQYADPIFPSSSEPPNTASCDQRGAAF